MEKWRSATGAIVCINHQTRQVFWDIDDCRIPSLRTYFEWQKILSKGEYTLIPPEVEVDACL